MQQQQQHSGTDANNTEWVTTRVAAAALGVKPQQVRNYIAAGDLESKTEGAGVKRRYLVSMTSVEALRAERRSEGKLPDQGHNGAEGLVTSEQEVATLVRELATELGEVRYRLGQAEARLELTKQALNDLGEQLQRERERADRLEAERERLVPDLLRERDRANAEEGAACHRDVRGWPGELRQRGCKRRRV